MLVVVGLYLFIFSSKVSSVSCLETSAILEPAGKGWGSDSLVQFSDLITVFCMASHTGPSACLELGATLAKLPTEQTFGLLLIF